MIINIYLIVKHYDWEFIKNRQARDKDFKPSEILKMFQYKDTAEKCLARFNEGNDIKNGAPWYYELVTL